MKYNFQDIKKGEVKHCGDYSVDAMRRLCSSAIGWANRNGKKKKFKTYKDNNRLMLVRVK